MDAEADSAPAGSRGQPALHAADDPRRRRHRAADRLRKHCRAAAGARFRAPARAGCSPCARCGPCPAGAAAAHRKRGAVIVWWRARDASCRMGRRSAFEPRAVRTAAHLGGRHQRPRGCLHVRRVARDRRAVRPRARAAVLKSRCAQRVEGRPVAGGALASRSACVARCRGMRAGDGAARRGRAVIAQFLAGPARGHGLRRPERADRAALAAAAQRSENGEVLRASRSACALQRSASPRARAAGCRVRRGGPEPSARRVARQHDDHGGRTGLGGLGADPNRTGQPGIGGLFPGDGRPAAARPHVHRGRRPERRADSHRQ